MLAVLSRHWFLASLLIVLAIGFVFAVPLAPLAHAPALRNLIVVVTLFVVTLPVDNSALQHAIRRPWPAMLASLISCVVLPVIAWPFSAALGGDLGKGLMVIAATPGTIASAAVWTRRAEGNEMVPILVTVITNMLCFVVTPFWLAVTIGYSDMDISFTGMALKLVLFVVLPMIAGQVARKSPAVAAWADRQTTLLSVISQCGILSIVLIGAIQCGLHLRASDVDASKSLLEFGSLGLLLAGIYCGTFALGMVLAKTCRMTRADGIGVAFSGSQKTLMVGLQVAIMIGGGLIILPMVMYHVLQLVIGTYFADRLREKGRDQAKSTQD